MRSTNFPTSRNLPRVLSTEARQVKAAYRQDDLARICTLREGRFGRAFGMETVQLGQASGWNGDYQRLYHFKDNGSRVLATAHLDTVVKPAGRVPHFTGTQYGPYIRSGALDDRLGAYVILKLLPAMGIRCDVLLTTGEELGDSTAADFRPGGKTYDHVIEFDRAGQDVVMYQYESRSLCDAVEDAGADVGSGSFSDIAYLEHLGVKALNWGVGYDGSYHSEAGYAYLDDTFMMVARYLRFFEQNKGVTMPHDPRADDDYYGGGGLDGCDFCSRRDCVDWSTGYCLDCGACMECGESIFEDGCQCYVPQKLRREFFDRSDGYWMARDAKTLTGSAVTMDEYLASRPASTSGQPEGTPRETATLALPAAAHPTTAQVLDSLHPERACLGCERCDVAQGAVRAMTGAIHVITAHSPDADVDGCLRCELLRPSQPGHWDKAAAGTEPSDQSEEADADQAPHDQSVNA